MSRCGRSRLACLEVMRGGEFLKFYEELFVCAIEVLLRWGSRAQHMLCAKGADISLFRDYSQAALARSCDFVNTREKVRQRM